MTDNVIKSLKWLIFNFPEIENPKDDADRISNCIHLYCQNAVDELNRQNAEIERLQNHTKNSFDGLLKQYEESVIKTAKSEAVREFAERVNQLTTSYWFDNINKEHIDYIVKEIVKEMGGDEECAKRQKNFFAS